MTETTMVCGHSNTDTTSFTKDVVETYTQTEKKQKLLNYSIELVVTVLYNILVYMNSDGHHIGMPKIMHNSIRR